MSREDLDKRWEATQAFRASPDHSRLGAPRVEPRSLVGEALIMVVTGFRAFPGQVGWRDLDALDYVVLGRLEELLRCPGCAAGAAECPKHGTVGELTAWVRETMQACEAEEEEEEGEGEEDFQVVLDAPATHCARCGGSIHRVQVMSHPDSNGDRRPMCELCYVESGGHVEPPREDVGRVLRVDVAGEPQTPRAPNLWEAQLRRLGLGGSTAHVGHEATRQFQRDAREGTREPRGLPRGWDGDGDGGDGDPP